MSNVQVERLHDLKDRLCSHVDDSKRGVHVDGMAVIEAAIVDIESILAAPPAPPVPVKPKVPA